MRSEAIRRLAGAVGEIYGADRVSCAAELLHELGVKRGLGLAIDAFGHAAAVTYAYVAVPADQTDAEYKMIGNGTKLGMPERHPRRTTDTFQNSDD